MPLSISGVNMSTHVHPSTIKGISTRPKPFRGISFHQPRRESKIAKKRRVAKHYMKVLQHHLHQQAVNQYFGEYDRVPAWWGPLNAAKTFSEKTGYPQERAERYFCRFWQMEENEAIVNRPLFLREYKDYGISNWTDLPH